MVGMIAYRRKSAPEELPPGPQKPPAPKPSAVERMKARQQGIQAAPYRQPIQPPRISNKSPFAPEEPDKPTPIQGPAASTPAPLSRAELAKIRGANPPEEDPASPEPAPQPAQKKPEIDTSDLSKLSTEQLLELYRKRQEELANQTPEASEEEQEYFHQNMAGVLPTPPKEWNVYMERTEQGEKIREPLTLRAGDEPHFDFREKSTPVPVRDKNGKKVIDPETGKAKKYWKKKTDPHVYFSTPDGQVFHIHQVNKNIPVLDKNGKVQIVKNDEDENEVVTKPETRYTIAAWTAPIYSKNWQRRVERIKPDWKAVRLHPQTVHKGGEKTTTSKGRDVSAEGDSHSYNDTLTFLSSAMGSREAAKALIERLGGG